MKKIPGALFYRWVSPPVAKVVPKDIPVHCSSALGSFNSSYHPLQKGNTDTGEVP